MIHLTREKDINKSHIRIYSQNKQNFLSSFGLEPEYGNYYKKTEQLLNLLDLYEIKTTLMPNKWSK